MQRYDAIKRQTLLHFAVRFDSRSLNVRDFVSDGRGVFVVCDNGEIYDVVLDGMVRERGSEIEFIL